MQEPEHDVGIRAGIGGDLIGDRAALLAQHVVTIDIRLYTSRINDIRLLGQILDQLGRHIMDDRPDGRGPGTPVRARGRVPG